MNMPIVDEFTDLTCLVNNTEHMNSRMLALVESCDDLISSINFEDKNLPNMINRCGLLLAMAKDQATVIDKSISAIFKAVKELSQAHSRINDLISPVVIAERAVKLREREQAVGRDISISEAVCRIINLEE